MFKKVIPALMLIFMYAGLMAQDTTINQTIKITSSYKPQLRNSVKIDLVATPLGADTTRPRLSYNIPAQNLFFSYAPVMLRPALLSIDSTVLLGTRNYVKGGFGSQTTPYLEAALGFGNGKESLLRVYGDYVSSRGKIKYQDFSNLNLRADGSLFTGSNEVYGSLGFSNREYYQYGYDHDLYDFSKEDLRRSYRTMNAGIGLKNMEANDWGINYNPHLELYSFSREGKAEESSLILNLPVEKVINEQFKARLEVAANINGYKENASSLKIDNSVFQVAPAVMFNNEILNLNLGLTPSWDNGQSALLPNIFGEIKLQENIFTIQGGWVGRFIANSYRTLSERNPYMVDPVFLNNTKEVEYYGGIKASLGGHFNFNAKAAFINQKNVPLFVNDDFVHREFRLINESRMNTLLIHGDLNYINQDKFSVTAGLDFRNFSGLKDNTNAWGMYPLTVSGSLRWKPLPELMIKGDVSAFSGAKALAAGNATRNLKGGTDLSAGAEYKITRMFSAWFDVNNLLNSKYEYWNNYPVYGLQVLGGVIVRF